MKKDQISILDEEIKGIKKCMKKKLEKTKIHLNLYKKNLMKK